MKGFFYKSMKEVCMAETWGVKECCVCVCVYVEGGGGWVSWHIITLTHRIFSVKSPFHTWQF